MPVALSILKKKVVLLFSIFGLWILVFIFQKPIFLLFYAEGLAQFFPVIWHGLPLDLSIAGYLTAVPGLLLLASCIPLKVLHTKCSEKILKTLMLCWFVIASIVVSLSFVANCALYSYWRFPLDSTPIFFITSSPKDAMASVSWWQAIFGIVSVCIITYIIYGLFRRLIRLSGKTIFMSVSPWETLAMLLLVSALFLPIRGGVTVASMNTGTAYFSDNQVLNHASVNPLFSFMESMSRQRDFAGQYRFMDDQKAHRLTERLLQSADTAVDSTHISILSNHRPDIYLIILESFSDTLMKVQGVTPCLNQLKRGGVYFSRFYANSFRTDRGLVSILQGYPSPATVSLMKYPKKTANIPSLAEHLNKAGWELSYYYGGDADFTNMRSFLVNQGFRDITEDVDFPIGDRLSKWGVPDHLLFQQVKKDLRQNPSNTPTFSVIQTSSSHEPFDVPYSRLHDNVLNAFAYTDSCLGDFVKFLKASGRWEKSLVIFVPDHLGAWPHNADNFASWRFHIPMIWTGGAVAGPRTVDTYASQQDIAATLLAQLGIVQYDLKFSKDIFNGHNSHYAFFMMNDGFGFIDKENEIIYDNKSRRTMTDKGKKKGKNLLLGQAYTQIIFDDIASR
ncbi:MAG: LTA synthase family protein [Prevotella sp.]|jgi:phosphoglycerol transferase MdoB-like AlkP superfamily enzyme